MSWRRADWSLLTTLFSSSTTTSQAESLLCTLRCRNSDVRQRYGLKEDVVTAVEKGMLRKFGQLDSMKENIVIELTRAPVRDVSHSTMARWGSAGNQESENLIASVSERGQVASCYGAEGRARARALGPHPARPTVTTNLLKHFDKSPSAHGARAAINFNPPGRRTGAQLSVEIKYDRKFELFSQLVAPPRITCYAADRCAGATGLRRIRPPASRAPTAPGESLRNVISPAPPAGERFHYTRENEFLLFVRNNAEPKR
ncbi:hypothetical protein EVAR_39297_1 [Eumeta japonica]|uniref:Uncharacterized protein n=1 Tax=Eumeta variegata TaxID=151549 RepID=A0A4C1VYB2_EUMVA|nr:hypothetical protein EVAR_39297_1 [Eumeta japonica]